MMTLMIASVFFKALSTQAYYSTYDILTLTFDSTFDIDTLQYDSDTSGSTSSNYTLTMTFIILTLKKVNDSAKQQCL